MLKGKVQTALRRIKQELWKVRAKGPHETVERNDAKGLYSYVKEDIAQNLLPNFQREQQLVYTSSIHKHWVEHILHR